MKKIKLIMLSGIVKMLTGVAVAALLVVSCKDDFTAPASPKGETISSIASADTSLDILVAALTRVNEFGSLGNNSSGTFTVFAPTDSAFAAYFRLKLSKPLSFNEDSVLQYINSKMSLTSTFTIAQLNTIIINHIVSSSYLSSTIHNGLTVVPLSGARLSLSKQGSTIVLNANLFTTLTAFTGAKSRVTDIIASNGVIHTINRVVMPPTIASLGSVIGFTVSNSVVPPSITLNAASTNYNVFNNALKKTALADTLVPNVSIPPDFTLFVPDDASFVNYLKTVSGTVTDEASAITFINSSTGQDSTTIAQVMRYHILKGRNLSSDFVAGAPVNTLYFGNTIEPDFTALTVTDNKGNVVPISTTRNQATGVASPANGSGVIHVINGVLRPF